MTSPAPGSPQWEQPDFTPTEPTIIPLWKQPKVVIGTFAVAGVLGGAIVWGSNHTQTGPTSDLPSATASNTYVPPSATPTETVTFTPEPSPTTTVSATPSEAQPSSEPENDNRAIIFNAKGKNGGQLSAPAISWGEGYRNVIRFTCDNSIVTAGLAVRNPEDKTVKTYDPTKLKWIFPRPCIGDAVSDNVAKHPSEYYPSLLALIVAKNKA